MPMLKILQHPDHDREQPSDQSGFVLLMVLVVIVLISGATVLLINQNAVDVRSAIYHHERQSLYAAADSALTPIWQISEHDMAAELAADRHGWLAALMVPASDDRYVMVKSCDGFDRHTSGSSDGAEDTVALNCPAVGGFYVWQTAYALPVAEEHYLHRLIDTNKGDAKENPENQSMQEARHIHVLSYAIAAQRRDAIKPCLSRALLHGQITGCLIDQGVLYQLVAAEWLVSIYQNPDPELSGEHATSAKVIRLRNYDLRTVRE